MFRHLILSAILSLLALSASAQTIERIQETKQLRLGFRVDAPPLSFADTDGNPAGYSPMLCGELAQAVTNALGLQDLSVSFVPVNADNRFDAIANGEIDLLCGAATITLRRREIVDFSVPTYVDGTAVMQRVDASGDLTQLAGKSVGVREATTTQEALTNTLRASGLEMDVKAYGDHRLGMQAMVDGDIEAYFADQSILLFLLGSHPDKALFRVSPEILTVEKHGLAMQHGDSDFRLLIDGLLSEMFAAGRVQDYFNIALPGAEPGKALRAMYVTSPTMP